jgi:site-specific DNA-methyltransferase (adenine-specific)
MPKSEVFNMDCLEYMRDLPDRAFDLAICDPPFGINAGEMRMNNNNHIFKSWDNEPPSPVYFKELFRVSLDQVIWGGNHFSLPASRCFIVWDKKQPEGVSFAMAEMAWTSFDSVPKVFYQFPSHVTQGKKIHPTQKPVALYKWLLTNYAKPGQSIFDSHLGSGSSRIAAYDLGFDFTACELDKDYFEAQERRFQDHIKQPKLFAPLIETPEQAEMF